MCRFDNAQAVVGITGPAPNSPFTPCTGYSDASTAFPYAHRRRNCVYPKQAVQQPVPEVLVSRCHRLASCRAQKQLVDGYVRLPRPALRPMPAQAVFWHCPIKGCQGLGFDPATSQPRAAEAGPYGYRSANELARHAVCEPHPKDLVQQWLQGLDSNLVTSVLGEDWQNIESLLVIFTALQKQ